MPSEQDVKRAVRKVLGDESNKSPNSITDATEVAKILGGDSSRVMRTTLKLRGYIKFHNPDATILRREVGKATLTFEQLAKLVKERVDS